MSASTQIEQINSAIAFGNFSNSELNSIIQAVKYRRGLMTRAVNQQLSVGTTVKFHSRKYDTTITGKVVKMAIKYVTVDSPRGMWKVPAHMLELA